MLMIKKFMAWIAGTMILGLLFINEEVVLNLTRKLIKYIGKEKVKKGEAKIFTNVSMDFDTVLTWSNSNHSPFVMHSDQGDIFVMHGVPGAFQVGVTSPISVELQDIGKWASKGKAYWLFSCAAAYRPHTIWSHGSLFRNIPACELGGISALSPIGDKGIAVWASNVYDCYVGGLNVGLALLNHECTVKEYISTFMVYMKN